jgi:hypothetical protein
MSRRGASKHPSVELSLWLGRAARDFEDRLARIQTPGLRLNERRLRREFYGLQRDLEKRRGRSSRAFLRRLMASGVVRHGNPSVPPPADHLPEEIILGFAVHALWPIITTRDLPRGWVYALGEITSHEVVEAVIRSRNCPEDSSLITLTQNLTQLPCAVGILNLLDDLTDPRRGGAALLALSIAAGKDSRAARTNPRSLLKWTAAAAAGGIVGNRADAAAEEAWSWLDSVARRDRSQKIKNHHLSPSPVGSSMSVIDVGDSLRGPSPGARGQRANDGTSFGILDLQ